MVNSMTRKIREILRMNGAIKMVIWRYKGSSRAFLFYKRAPAFSYYQKMNQIIIPLQWKEPKYVLSRSNEWMLMKVTKCPFTLKYERKFNHCLAELMID